MLFDNPNSILVHVKAFLKPEEFYEGAVYLLFSNTREKERRYETKIVEAFKSAELVPKRLTVEERVIILECDGYAQTMAYDQIYQEASPIFTRFFMPATYNISVGNLPRETSSSRHHKVEYKFRQT